jgi:hypothetical protein
VGVTGQIAQHLLGPRERLTHKTALFSTLC